jgi:hypothetical protein
MSETQYNKLIVWVKTQWSMPGFWPGKAKIIGLAYLGFAILGAIFHDPEKKVPPTSSSPSSSVNEIAKDQTEAKKPKLKKLPHSKKEMLAVIESVSFPDPNNVIDNSEKAKEEHIVKLNGGVNNEIKQAVDMYIKKYLIEINDIKKDMEEDIKKGSLDEPNYLSILSILVNKQTIFFSSKPEDSDIPFLKNIMDNEKMVFSNIPETAQYEKEVIEKFREQIDIKPIETLLSIYKGDAEVKKAMELSRVQRERDEKIKNDAEAIKRRGSKPINSGWDNSIPEVCTYLRENLKDPSSVEYTYWSEPLAEGEYWLVKCTYRAKNSFGGYMQRSQVFYIREGKVVLAR